MSLRLISLMLAAALAATPAFADKGGKDRPPGREKAERGGGSSEALISAAERALIHDYFGGGRIQPQPLPPGIAKNVARGKPLPPGIAKRLPDDLQLRLRPPPGHVYGVVGSDVVLLNAATNIVVEVLRGVLR